MIWLWVSIILIHAVWGWRRRRALERALGQVKAKLGRIQEIADPKDGRPADEQLEDLLAYMDDLTNAIDTAGVGDEARALDEPRAVAEAIDILAERARDAVEEIDALKADRDREKERAQKAEGQAFAETGDRITLELRVKEAERDMLSGMIRADRLAAENVALRDALDKIWHEVGAGVLRQAPDRGWARATEAALLAPETAKVRAVLEAAKALDAEPASVQITHLRNAVKAWEGKAK